jgi:hypothetical protein
VRALDRKPEGSPARAARALLLRRGLSDAVLDEADAMLAVSRTLPPATEPPRARATDEEARAAEDAVWAWYREWSDIARATVRDARLLGVLGFSKVGRPKGAKSRPKAKR